jgi:gentisate 1,2-dioxygenase
LSVVSEASGSDSDSGALDLFQFSDAPIFSKLNLFREEVGR